MLLVLILGLLASTTSFAQTAETYRQKALEFSRDKSWDQAIENYRKALAIEPEDADTHYNLALTLKYEGDARAAVEEFQAVVRLRPKWADAHYGLGATWYDLHDQQAALEELRTAIHLDPANAARGASWRVFTSSGAIRLPPQPSCGRR
jgi:tetratricopeptide (TPR) repeat protein